MYIEGDVPYVTNGASGNGNGFWGGDGIWAILLLALLGNNGWGNGRGSYGAGNEFVGYELGKVASTNDVASGFNNSSVLNGINGIKENQLSMQNFINQGFAGLNTQLAGEFRNVDNAICTLGYQNQAGFNTLAHQISDCCCATQRAIDSVNFNASKNTCDIIQAINAGNQRLVDIYTNDKIDTLNRKLAVAENKALTYENNAYLINQIKPCAIPSYNVPNPNCCYQQSGCFGCGNGF